MNALFTAGSCVLALSFWSCGHLDSSRLEPGDSSVYQAPSEAEMVVDSIEGIVARAYDAISGAQGEQRDWDRFYDLFLPGQGILQAVYRDQDGQLALRRITPEQYATMAQGLFDQEGFYESELHQSVDRFGSVAHVFSTYESRREPGAKPFARGINSIQLFWDGKRWYILSIFWDQEYADQSIPMRYLPR